MTPGKPLPRETREQLSAGGVASGESNVRLDGTYGPEDGEGGSLKRSVYPAKAGKSPRRVLEWRPENTELSGERPTL